MVAGNTVESEGTLYGLMTNLYGDAEYINTTIHGNTMSADKALSGVFTSTYSSTGGDLDVINSAVTENTLSVTSTDSYYAGTTISGSYYGSTTTFLYSDFYGNSGPGVDFQNYGSAFDPIGSDGNIDAAPGYASTSGANPNNWDLTLKANSDLVDAGSPDIEDIDGSVSDIGAYGGPESW